jgi:hypothetical protein
MNVILHIGAPKTGTSAIQFFLNENRNRLKKHGFYYPEHNFDPNNVSGGHASFGALLVEGNVEEAKKLLQQWLHEAKACNCRLLLSAEAMYRRPDSVVSLFEGHELEVFAYFRHPLESLISNHNQSIKRHYSTLTLDDFLYKQVGVNNRGVNGQVFFDWQKLLKDDQLTIRPYYFPTFHKGRIELDFLQQIGIDGWSAKRFKLQKRKINTSYTEGALEIKRLLNGVLNPEKNRESIVIDRVLQGYSDKSNNKLGTAKKQAINTAVFKAISERYQHSMKRMKDKLLAFCPDAFMQPQTVAPLAQTEARKSLYDVMGAYQELCRQEPDLMERVQCRLADKLQSEERDEMPYAQLKLAEIMGLPVREPKPKPPLPSNALDVFLSEKSKPVDYLREISKWLERYGDTESACEVLDKAIELAAKGEKKKALQRLRKTYQQRLEALNAEDQTSVQD